MGPYENWKTGTLRKPENRDPSRTLPKPENRDPSGTLQKPENWDPSWTLQKPENRDPSEPYINATCGKNVLHKQHGQLGFHFLMFF